MEEELSGERLVRAEAQKQMELSEDQLAMVEAKPKFQLQMEQSAADIEAGRILTHSQVEEGLKGKGRTTGGDWQIVWPQSLIESRLKPMSESDRERILIKAMRMDASPEVFPVRASGPFSGYRWFVANLEWLVYCRVADGKVYPMAIWHA